MAIPALLSAADLMAQCRVDDPGEAPILLAMGAAAERHIESQTGHVLTWRSEFIRDIGFPHEGWGVLRFPVHAVASIGYTDVEGAAAVLAPSAYVLAPAAIGYVLRLRAGQSWPAVADDSEVNIEIHAGYPAGACPEPLVQAAKLLAAHFYANRETVAAGQMAELPFAVNALLADFRLSYLA